MPYVRCDACDRVTHIVVWHVGRDVCRSCGRPLLRAVPAVGARPSMPPPVPGRERAPGDYPHRMTPSTLE